MMFRRSFILMSFIAAVLMAPSAGFAEEARKREASSSYNAKLCRVGVWGRLLKVRPQTVRLVETHRIGKKKVQAYKFGKLKGKYGKLYLFGEVKDGCFVKVISFGSYQGTTDRARQFGAVKGKQRAYHIDEYTGGGHSTIRMGSKRYNFRQAWKVAKRYF